MWLAQYNSHYRSILLLHSSHTVTNMHTYTHTSMKGEDKADNVLGLVPWTTGLELAAKKWRKQFLNLLSSAISYSCDYKSFNTFVILNIRSQRLLLNCKLFTVGLFLPWCLYNTYLKGTILQLQAFRSNCNTNNELFEQYRLAFSWEDAMRNSHMW